MSNVLNFLFFIDFIVIQKKKIIFRENYQVKRKIFICEISIIIIIIIIIIILIWQKLESVRPVQQKIKLLPPKLCYCK